MSRRRKRAYILIIVLGFAAVATSLGLAFLSASGTVMPEAMNYAGSLRAGYIAGSGIAMGMHYAMYPPTSVGYGQYWSGANNISIGAGNDYVNVTMARSDSWTPAQTDPNLYRVTATGVAYDADGTTVRAKKQITADVLVPLTGKWQIPYAFFSNGSVSVPATVQLYGDLHTNGVLSGLGWTQSKLTSFSFASWLGTGPPASITASAPRFTPYPSATTTYYSTYTIQGKTYTAYTGFSGNSMDSGNAATLNALNMGSTNPGRIIIAQAGDFKIKKGVQLINTTLVVTGGDVQFDDDGTGSGTQLSSLPFFPALVVQGNLTFTHNAATVTINGPVICSGKIIDNTRNSIKLDVTGTCIVGTGFTLTDLLTGRYRFYYNQAKATFWDFQNVVPPQPATILNWQEN